jgi:hypothetical protein
MHYIINSGVISGSRHVKKLQGASYALIPMIFMQIIGMGLLCGVSCGSQDVKSGAHYRQLIEKKRLFLFKGKFAGNLSCIAVMDGSHPEGRAT